MKKNWVHYFTIVAIIAICLLAVKTIVFSIMQIVYHHGISTGTGSAIAKLILQALFILCIVFCKKRKYFTSICVGVFPFLLITILLFIPWSIYNYTLDLHYFTNDFLTTENVFNLIEMLLQIIVNAMIAVILIIDIVGLVKRKKSSQSSR